MVLSLGDDVLDAREGGQDLRANYNGKVLARLDLRCKAHSPSGDLVEHVIAEGQVPVFWQNFGLLCRYPHTQEWICFVAELRSFHD